MQTAPLDDSSTSPTFSNWRPTPIAIGAMASMAFSVAAILMAADNWELQLPEMPRNWWPELHHVFYHNRVIYCIDPFWVASFGSIFPAIWLKRRMPAFLRVLKLGPAGTPLKNTQR